MVCMGVDVGIYVGGCMYCHYYNWQIMAVVVYAFTGFFVYSR